jgi:hypothetical protein
MNFWFRLPIFDGLFESHAQSVALVSPYPPVEASAAICSEEQKLNILLVAFNR